MNSFERFKQKFKRFGIPNLMLYIIATTLAVFIADNILRLNLSSFIFFSRDAVMSGQIWRIITFIFLPPTDSIFWILIALLFYYNMGSSLENAWGSTKFTRYYLLGMLGAIIAGFITGYADNVYLNLSLMLAFAQLFPDTQFLLFFVIPIKAKYIGYFQLGLYGISAITMIFTKNWVALGALIASLINFFIFFGPGMFRQYKQKAAIKKRRQEYRRNLRNPDKDNDSYY